MTTPTARGISETDVWQAADALLLEGARPTIERVRQKIGRGSPNTVSPYLETWFKHLGARIADPHAFSAPPALPDPISQAAAYFWEAAMTQARAEVAVALEAGRAELERHVANSMSSGHVYTRRQPKAPPRCRPRTRRLSYCGCGVRTFNPASTRWRSNR